MTDNAVPAFAVSISIGPTTYEAEHPPQLTQQQQEVLLVTVMRIIQSTGGDPWEMVARLSAGVIP